MNQMDIEQATEQFRRLLTEQLARQEDMERNAAKADLQGKPVTIGICPGDGIGPIIVQEAVRVMEVLLAEDLASGQVALRPIEGLTIEARQACGKPLPPETLEAVLACDVLLKGPTMTPKGGTLESANVALRRELDLYANCRPVTVPEKGIDWMFFRENTEGEYVLGSRGVEVPGKLAMDFRVTTDAGTRRIARAALAYARANGKTRVTVVTKANILKKTDGLFSQICQEEAAAYPEIQLEDLYVDIMTAKLIDPAEQGKFQVILTPNLYGDILTDEAAQIQGGVGTAGSVNMGDRYAMFEAVHGTAPQLIEEGKGHLADPSSILKATEMLLRHIGRVAQADCLQAALDRTHKAPGESATALTDRLLEELG